LFCALIALVPNILLMIVVGVAAASVSNDPYASPAGAGIALIVIGGGLIAVVGHSGRVPCIAVAGRLPHDANFSGLFYLLNLTSIGGIVVLVMTFMPPKPEGQRFDA